jgi:hypothetical protein
MVYLLIVSGTINVKYSNKKFIKGSTEKVRGISQWKTKLHKSTSLESLGVPPSPELSLPIV